MAVKSTLKLMAGFLNAVVPPRPGTKSGDSGAATFKRAAPGAPTLYFSSTSMLTMVFGSSADFSSVTYSSTNTSCASMPFSST